jgi:hypothetical protein
VQQAARQLRARELDDLEGEVAELEPAEFARDNDPEQGAASLVITTWGLARMPRID